MRSYAYLCLDCDKVFYVARYRAGETVCPRCGGRYHVPLGAVLPPLGGRMMVLNPGQEVRP